MFAKKRKIVKVFVLILISIIITLGSSYFIYAATVEKTTITCVDQKMFEALKNKLNNYILLGDADSSNLTIKIPTENISDITEINLENCDISDITGIENLTSLSVINLSKNKIKNITQLDNLMNITDLNLNNNSELGSSSSISSVIRTKTGILKLKISNIGLSDISFLSNLTSLQELYMSSASINNLTDIANLGNLVTLDVSSNRSLRSIETILNFSRLKVLNISNTGIDSLELDSTNGIGIYNLRNLEELYARGIEVKTAPIAKTFNANGTTTAYLEKIKKLDLSYVNTSGSNSLVSISQLAYLKNIEVLYLQGNKMTSVDYFYKFENLQEINLAENNISDISKFIKTKKQSDGNGGQIEVVTDWLHATYIDLHDNKISDISIFRKFPTINEVVSLDLQRNNIYDISSIENFGAPNISIRLYDQVIDWPVFYKKIEANQYIFLPHIFQQAKNNSSIAYDQNARYSFIECELNNEDIYQVAGNYNVIIDHKWTVSDTAVSTSNPNANETITATLTGGIASGSKVRFIISTNNKAIDSLKFNDPNFAQAISDDLIKKVTETSYIKSGGKILNVSNFIIAQTTELDASNGNIQDITGVENFFNLKSFNISKNPRITSIEPIKYCNLLNSLDASETSIKNNYGAIVSLKDLKTLILNNVGMTNINNINALTNDILDNKGKLKLEELDISSNLLSDITGVEKITTLKTITATNNLLEEIPSLITLENLERLSLYSNQLKEIPKIAGLQNLQYLFVSNNKIANLSNLAEINCDLIELDLSNNLVTDDEIEQIRNIRIRRNLNLSGNIISDITPMEASLGTLQELDISKNNIADISLIDNRFSRNSTLHANNQRIAMIANTNGGNIMETTLPQIFSASKQSSSMVYTENDFIVQNCTVNGNTVTVNLNELGDKVATVQIDGGKADGTTLSIVFPIQTRVTFSTQQKTNQDVIATIEFTNRDHVKITNNDGNNQYVFKDNGEFTFKYIDDYGMMDETKVEVTWIDKKPPTLNVEYSITEKTKENVTVTITSDEEVQPVNGWSLSQDKNTLVKTYTENKEEEITVKDLLGNETKQNINVSNIDKTPPEVTINYSTTEVTKNPVIVTITSNEEIQPVDGWTLSNNKKVLTKEYRSNTSENGEAVVIKDLAGNEVTKTITVRNIQKGEEEPKIESSKYEVKENKISDISPNTTVADAIRNMTIIADTIKVYNAKNQEVQNSNLIGTGMKIVLNGEVEYTIVVKGDTSGDGKTDIADLLAVNKHRLNKVRLTGVYFEAGDTTGDNKVDIQDLIQINKHRLGKITL